MLRLMTENNKYKLIIEFNPITAIEYSSCYKTFIMEFIEMYQLFKTEEDKIWKIETTLIPKEDVSHWRERGVFITKEDLADLGVNVL